MKRKLREEIKKTLNIHAAMRMRSCPRRQAPQGRMRAFKKKPTAEVILNNSTSLKLVLQNPKTENLC